MEACDAGKRWWWAWSCSRGARGWDRFGWFRTARILRRSVSEEGEKGQRIENDLANTTTFPSSPSAPSTTSSSPLLFPPLPYAVINPFFVRLGLLLTLPPAPFKILYRPNLVPCTDHFAPWSACLPARSLVRRASCI